MPSEPTDKRRHLRVRPSSPDRPAFALLAVLVVVIIAATLATNFLSAQSTSIGIARNIQNRARARFVAESGLAFTIAYVQQDNNWRTNRTQGTWVTAEPFGDGTFTVVVADGEDTDGDGVISIPAEGDGLLSDDPTDPITLTATGLVGGSTQIVRAVLRPGGVAGPVLGTDNEYASQQSNVDDIQIATQVVLAEDVTVTAISAYIKGAPPKELRYGIYTDSGGEPDTLVVSTNATSTGSGGFGWLQIAITSTDLSAGTYWLAMSFESQGMAYRHTAGGETRYKNHDAVANGFLSPWGASDASLNHTISIHAVGTTSNGSAFDVGWVSPP